MGVSLLFTPSTVTHPVRQGGQIPKMRRENSFMKTTAGFRAQQVMRLTVVSTLLFLTVGADAPLYAASSRNPLPEGSPAMLDRKSVV